MSFLRVRHLHIMSILLLFATISSLTSRSLALTKPYSLRLVNNGYEGLVVAIHEDVPESSKLIEEIMSMFKEASPYLYEATRRRIYISQVTILVPPTWSDKNTYVSPGNATFDAADVILAQQDPRFAQTNRIPSVPHTKHFEGCGKQAAHIHFSPELLTFKYKELYYGNIGRLFVHEWGHYRWGLFNEYADQIADPEFQQPFYHSPTTNLFEPTRCSRDWVSSNMVVDSSLGIFRDCSGDKTVGYEDGCFSIPASRQPRATGSIMYGYQSIEEITQFCDNDTSDSSNLHVTEAPHKHNRLCDSRSSWEVMRQHPDFTGDNSQPRDISDGELESTRFVIARTVPPRVVLVLDTSGSMGRFRRIVKEATLTRNFLTTTVIEGNKVGLVSFSSEEETQIISELVLLDSDDTKHRLAEMVPMETTGSSTCIGCGMEKALEVIQRDNRTSQGARVVLITDGKNTVIPDKIQEMKTLFVEKRITLDCVAFSEDADEVLQELSSETGGRLFLQTDSPSSSGLHDVFISTLSVAGKTEERPLELLTQSFLLPANKKRTGGVFVDSTIGNRTTFEFIYYLNKKRSPIEVMVTSPSREIFERSTAGYAEDLTFHIITIRIPGTAEPGLWTFDVTSLHPADVELLVTIISYPSQLGVEPIIAKAELSSSATDLVGGDPLVAFAEIRQGFNPVINCGVTATIEGPNGTSVDIKLLDNGAGADITSRDGIYSRFVTTLAGVGFYGIKIVVDNSNGTAVILNKNGAELPYSGGVAYVDPDKLLTEGIPKIDGEQLFLPGMPVPSLKGTPAPLFVRQTSAGSSRISVSDASLPVNLDAPPSKINDLRVTSTSYEEKEVILAFSAPGDDLDHGTAHHYVILQSNTSLNRIPDLWQVISDDAVKGDLRAPSPFGNMEEFAIRVTNPLHLDTLSYFFAILAYDNSNNVSPMSNVVLATLRRFIPSPPPPSSLYPTRSSPVPSDAISSTKPSPSWSRRQTSPQPSEVISSTGSSPKEQFTNYFPVIFGGGSGVIVAIAVFGMALIAYNFQNTPLCRRRPKFLDEENVDAEGKHYKKENHNLSTLPI